MSDVAKLSSRDVKSWLERETSSLFLPVHSKAQKLLDEMRKMLGSLANSSRMLLENSGKEIEKRNMKTYGRARALNRLARLFVDRMRLLKAPDKVTYDSLQVFVQETQKAFLVTDVDIRNFFPHVSPFFILDRRKFQIIFERAKESLKELNDFLTKEYVKTKTLEDTFQLIDKLQTLEQQLTALRERKSETETEKARIGREIAGTQQSITDLKGKGSLNQLSQTAAEIEVLNGEVRHSLQHLQKPFVKLQSLALHGEGSGLTPEETSKLNQYVENPFEAFATEETNHPLLSQILQKLKRSMSDGKLKLKPEKVRKAEQAIKNILDKNSLANLHQKSMNATSRRKQLSTSTEVAETEKELSKLKEQLDGQERRRKIIEGEQTTIVRTITETQEKIRSHKSEIEKNVFDFMDKMIRIE